MTALKYKQHARLLLLFLQEWAARLSLICWDNGAAGQDHQGRCFTQLTAIASERQVCSHNIYNYWQITYHKQTAQPAPRRVPSLLLARSFMTLKGFLLFRFTPIPWKPTLKQLEFAQSFLGAGAGRGEARGESNEYGPYVQCNMETHLTKNWNESCWDSSPSRSFFTLTWGGWKAGEHPHESLCLILHRNLRLWRETQK